MALLPFIDAHHHFWDPHANYHPWLSDEPPIPFRYGDYRALRRPFLPADYVSLARDHNVAATVTMEGEWDPTDPVGETRWLQSVAGEHGQPIAHVAQAWLDAADAEGVLAAQAAFDIVRSVRHKPRAAPSPGAVEHGAPGSMGCPRWQAGYARLREHELRFDLQTPWWHLREALALAERFPETPIVLNHTGLPSDRSQAGLAAWRRAMSEFAGFPGAWVKISGLGLAGEPWRLEDNVAIIHTTIELFGVDRCMFASNFPVDGLCGSYDTIIGGYRAAIADLPLADQARLLNGTAAACYALNL